MDNTKALHLLSEGGVVLLLEGPERIEFGIDQQTWITKTSTLGLKMIPAGFHFIHWKLTGETASISKVNDDQLVVNSSIPTGLLLGMFIFVSPGQMIIRKWDPYLEDFAALPQEEAQRYEHGISQYDFDKQLGAYPRDNQTDWENLTNYISKNTIQRCAPLYNKITSLPYVEQQQQKSQSIREKTSTHRESENPESEQTPKNQREDKRTFDPLHSFRFTEIPSRWVPPGCSGQDLTKYFMDRTAFLEYIFSSKFHDNLDEFLGEFQFAFVAFWLAESYEGFEYWKNVLGLITSCESGLETHAKFFVKLLKILRAQVEIVPQDFFVDVLSCENFLEPALQSLFELLEEPALDNQLTVEYLKLKSVIEKRFNRSFSIVELDDCEVVAYE
jgi:A1 cistron-splicing factor AAR2